MLRAFLVLTPEINSFQLQEFSESIKTPSKQDLCNLVIDNILDKIATSGGSRDPVNIYKYNLIKVESDESQNYKLDLLFDGKDSTYYVSQPKQDSHITISLPPFLRLRLTSYFLQGPPKLQQRAQGGPSSWAVYGSNDNHIFDLLDSQSNNKDLEKEGAFKDFNIKEAEKIIHHEYPMINLLQEKIAY